MKATCTYRVEYFLPRLHFKLLKRKAKPFFFFFFVRQRHENLHGEMHFSPHADCKLYLKWKVSIKSAFLNCLVTAAMLLNVDDTCNINRFGPLHWRIWNTFLPFKHRFSKQIKIIISITKMFTGKAFSLWAHPVASTLVLVLFSGFTALHKLMEGHAEVGTRGSGRLDCSLR